MRKNKHILILATLATILSLFFTSCKSSTTNNISYSFNCLGTTYSGSYEGQVHGNLPNGEGTFYTSADYTPSFSVTGTWENGLLVSNATLSYSDGSTLTAKFTDGNITGTVTYTFPDKTYQKYKCISGEPSGLITNYSADGTITSYDWFYQSVPISTLKETSSEVEYSELIYHPTSYYGIPIRVSGTIQQVYDTPSKSYCILTDKQNHSYILTYKNTTPSTYNQSRTPNLILGDKITAYGYVSPSSKVSTNNMAASHLAMENYFDADILQNLFLETTQNGQFHAIIAPTSDSEDSEDSEDSMNSEDSSNTASEQQLESDSEKNSETEKESSSAFGTSCPYLTLITADFDNQNDFDYLNPSYSYDEINRFPYYYSGLKHTFTGEIINMTADYETDCIRMMICESNTDNIYYCKYFYTTTNGESPVIGDTVTVTGTLKGNFKMCYSTASNTSKVTTNDVYILYPRLRISKISIN